MLGIAKEIVMSNRIKPLDFTFTPSETRAFEYIRFSVVPPISKNRPSSPSAKKAILKPLDFTFTPSETRAFEHVRFSIPIPKNSPAKKAVTHLLSGEELTAFKNFIDIVVSKTPAEKQPFLTLGATSTEDEIANVSFFIRTLMPESVPTEAIGITTGENVFQGAWVVYKTVNRYKKAMKIEDRGGMFESGVDAARGVTQALGGAAYLGYRGTMIAADISGIDTSINAVTPLGRAAYTLGFVGNVFFAIFYVLIGIWSSYGFVKNWQFSLAMKAHEHDDSVLFDFLTKKVNVDPRAKLEKLNAYWSTLRQGQAKDQIAAFKEKLSGTALEKFSRQILKWQSELQAEGKLQDRPLKESEVKGILKRLFEQQESKLCENGVKESYLSLLGIDEGDLKKTPFTVLELIGFALVENTRQRKKQAKFSRVCSGDAINAVQKAKERGLKERLKCEGDRFVQESAKKELAHLKGKVTLDNNRGKWMHGMMAIGAAIGLVSTVLALFTLPPAGGIALIVLTLLLCGSMLMTDGCFMLEGWGAGNLPGKADKIYLVVISMAIIAAMGLSIGVTLGLGLPIMPLILACVIGVTGLVLSSAAYYKLHHNEKKWKEDHPDLATFSALLNANLEPDAELDEKITTLFKKLPKADRQAIRRQYIAMGAHREISFRKPEYRILNAQGTFCEEFLQKIVRQNIADVEQDYKLLLSALKKTVKFFWEKAALTKTENDRLRALNMQGLLERVKQKNSLEATAKLNEIKADLEAYRKLKNNLWYVAKRQESIKDLKNVVGKISQPQADIRSQFFPLIQRYSN